MRSTNKFGLYYYGEHRWDNYLIDIQQAVEEGNAQASILAREQVIELDQQTQELGSIRNTLQSGLEDMRAEFEWGFSLVVDRMDVQSKQIAEVAAKLGELHKTLKSPLMTQAQELFELGEMRLDRGLLDKALESFLQSEKKNDVNFLLQFQIGKLLLYGIGLVDLPEAERHFLLSAQFANAEKNTIRNWRRYCGEAYFHAGIAAYLLGEKEQLAQRPGAMRMRLQKSLDYLLKSRDLWPDFLDSAYTKAKCHSLLGQVREAQSEFTFLSDRDRRYFGKAMADQDFQSMQAQVEEVFRYAVACPGSLAKKAEREITRTRQALQWAIRSTGSEGFKNASDWQQFIEVAQQALSSTDVDVVGLLNRVAHANKSLVSIADRAYAERRRVADQSVKTQEQRKSSLESTVRAKVEERNNTKGKAGMGCLAGFVTYAIVALFIAIELPSWNKRLGNDMPSSVALGMALGIVVLFFVTGISRRRKRVPINREIDKIAHDIADSSRSIDMEQKKLSELESELRQFAAWRVQE